MKTICWIQHASEWPAFSQLAAGLSEKGYRNIFVCKSRNAYEAYKKLGFTTYYLFDEFNPDDLNKETAGSEQFDTTYGPPYSPSIYSSDLQLQYYCQDLHKGSQLIAFTYRFWESLMTRESIDYFIARETATVLPRTAYNIANKRSVPFAQLTIGPGSGYTIMYDVDETHVWQELEEAVKVGSRELSTEEKKVVDGYVSKRLPSVSPGGKMSMRFVPRSIIKTIREYLGLIWYDNNKNRKSNPMYVGSMRYRRWRLRRQLEWKYLTRNFFRYDEAKDSDKFVYFPVYSGLETSYLTQTPYWAVNMVSLMTEVARTLPAGMFLYIKEHPLNPGGVSYKELRQLRRIPNVKIIAPETSSQYLIETSQLVFTTQGTAGWEAFLSKKPVLCLGKTAFYSRSSLVYKANSVTDIPKMIAAALRSKTNIYVERAEEWYWFIYTVINTSGKGDTVLLDPPYGFNSDANTLKDLVDYMAKRIEVGITSGKTNTQSLD